MKFYLKLFFTFYSCFLYSQRYGEYYVTNQNDTVMCEIPNHSYQKVTVIENGQKKKFKPHQIKLFSVFVGKPVKYVSLLNDSNQFYVERIEGKLSLYNIDVWNAFTKSIQLANVLVKDDRIVKLNSNSSNRAKIAKLISDCENVFEEWNDSEKYPTENIERVVISYNNCMVNK